MKKYNITEMPKTLDEMYNISKYIYEEENFNKTEVYSYDAILNGKSILYYFIL